MAKDAAGSLLEGAREVEGVRVLAAEFDGDLREQADRLRDQLGTGVVVLAARRGPKVQLLAAATKDIAGSKVHAGKLIQVLAPPRGRTRGRPARYGPSGWLKSGGYPITHRESVRRCRPAAPGVSAWWVLTQADPSRL